MKKKLTYYDSAQRAELLANYLIENRATVRSTALHFGISKSTVHKDLTQQLKNINHALFLQAESILQKNKAERHLRGGEATRKKFKGRGVKKRHSSL
ncbi:MAG: sporulation transcriptional regulator SpoIIID [Clostridia bacterium]|nr:sporulation transcriptional regulator SpoIIID [Clostridia bacterium]